MCLDLTGAIGCRYISAVTATDRWPRMSEINPSDPLDKRGATARD